MNPYRKSRTDDLPHDPRVEATAATYEAQANAADYAARRARNKHHAQLYASEAKRLRGLANRLRVA